MMAVFETIDTLIKDSQSVENGYEEEGFSEDYYDDMENGGVNNSNILCDAIYNIKVAGWLDCCDDLFNKHLPNSLFVYNEIVEICYRDCEDYFEKSSAVCLVKQQATEEQKIELLYHYIHHKGNKQDKEIIENKLKKELGNDFVVFDDYFKFDSIEAFNFHKAYSFVENGNNFEPDLFTIKLKSKKYTLMPVEITLDIKDLFDEFIQNYQYDEEDYEGFFDWSLIDVLDVIKEDPEWAVELLRVVNPKNIEKTLTSYSKESLIPKIGFGNSDTVKEIHHYGFKDGENTIAIANMNINEGLM
jgi:hypothetical protein